MHPRGPSDFRILDGDLLVHPCSGYAQLTHVDAISDRGFPHLQCYLERLSRRNTSSWTGDHGQMVENYSSGRRPAIRRAPTHSHRGRSQLLGGPADGLQHGYEASLNSRQTSRQNSRLIYINSL